MRTLLALLLVAQVSWAGPEDAAVKVNRTRFSGDRASPSSAEGGWGSGTVVARAGGESLVLTNKHVAPDENAFYFVQHDRYTYPARWVAADDRTDLAILRVENILPVATLAEAEPAAGAPVRHWGCPHAGPMTLRKGVVESDADNHRDADRYPFLQTTARSDHGDSGAGVFDAAGQLVGVCYGGPEWDRGYRGPAFSQNVRLADVKRFLKGRE